MSTNLTLHKGENCNFTSQIKPQLYKSCKKKVDLPTIIFTNPIFISGRMAIVGEKEAKGPLKDHFKNIKHDPKIGKKTFEKAEYIMLEEAVRGAILDSGKKISDIDLFICGDLINQLTSSSYVARNLNIPYLGVYSACSTFSESLAIGGMFIDSGKFNNISCATVSHFATAERQFRYPLEYGCQRPPYAQWTVTGSGSILLSSEKNLNSQSNIKMVAATFGKVIDFGTNDMSNMGAAMAPAAMDTLSKLFQNTNSSPKDYDLIVTGDLGKLGSDILRDLMLEKGYTLKQNYIDCGSLIYDHSQNCYQGGSGCGCSAAVVSAYVLDKMQEGDYKKVIFVATGALMSPQTCNQGETIPCIAHAVILETC